MGSGTTISWTDATWNPIRGCRRTAPSGSKQSGCGDPTGGGCYAERQAARFCGPGGAYEGLVKLTNNGPRWTGKTKFVEEHLLDPLRWSTRRRIFTDSMSDLFFDGFTDAEIDQVVAVMVLAAHRRGHIFQTLTKRPARMRRYFTDPSTASRVLAAADKIARKLPHNHVNWAESDPSVLLNGRLWWGVSVENQAAADERIPELLDTPAAVRFLSCEPLLGPVDISEYFDPCSVPCGEEPWPELDWVIAGCESGPRSRECQVPWLRSLRDQCATAGVAFFLKQAEESVDDDNLDGTLDAPIECMPEGAPVIAISKRKGRGPDGNQIIEIPHLDGVQHAEFPEVRHG